MLECPHRSGACMAGIGIGPDEFGVFEIDDPDRRAAALEDLLARETFFKELPSIEQHVEWITECVTHLNKHGIKQIEPALDAENAWIVR